MVSPTWRHWIEAARPRTLSAAVVPVGVGTALAVAHHTVAYGKASLCLVFAMLVQVGTNFANDYFDFVKGADTPDRVGPRRAVAAGLISPAAMISASAVVLGLALLTGFVLVREDDWMLLALGIVSILCALAYTGGPFPLAYHGLGDVFVFIFFGLVAVTTTFYVQAAKVTSDVLWTAVAIGLLAANILVVNNYRDAETDARAGKRTLVVRLGRKVAVWQYALSHLIALLCPAVLLLHGYHWPVLLPLLLAPWAAVLTRRLAASRESAEQIRLLGATAGYLAVFGGLLCAGLMLGGRQ